MSAELMRRAAALMRKRAEDVAGPTRWEPGERCIWDAEGNVVVRDGTEGDGGFEFSSDAAYAAAMDPTVGLGVADWLDAEASRCERVVEFDRAYGDTPDDAVLAARANDARCALAVAHAYLREDT